MLIVLEYGGRGACVDEHGRKATSFERRCVATAHKFTVSGEQRIKIRRTLEHRCGIPFGSLHSKRQMRHEQGCCRIACAAMQHGL